MQYCLFRHEFPAGPNRHRSAVFLRIESYDSRIFRWQISSIFRYSGAKTIVYLRRQRNGRSEGSGFDTVGKKRRSGQRRLSVRQAEGKAATETREYGRNRSTVPNTRPAAYPHRAGSRHRNPEHDTSRYATALRQPARTKTKRLRTVKRPGDACKNESENSGEITPEDSRAC